MRLLLAEDELELAKSLKTVLERNKFSVDVVDNGADVLEYTQACQYDGIILDIMMPVLDGITVLQTLRKQGCTTPVMLLTAKAEIDDRVIGLDAGADDYLTKPFALSELLARVRAMLRRRNDYIPDVLQAGNLKLDKSTFELQCDGRKIRLGGREFQMMELFLTNPHRVFQTAQLMDRIWGWDSDADVSVVWVYVSNLRKKLTKLNASVEIHTIPGVGYSLETKA